MLKSTKYILTTATLFSLSLLGKNEVLAEESISTKTTSNVTFSIEETLEDNTFSVFSIPSENETSIEVKDKNETIHVVDEETHELIVNLEKTSPVKIVEEEKGVFSIFDEDGNYNNTIAVMGIQNEENQQLPIKEVLIEDERIAIEFDTSSVTGETQILAAKASNPYSYYFSKGSWITRSGKVSLSLTPKAAWVRIARTNSNPNASNALRVDSWRKVLSKYSSNSRWKNTTSMKSQYDCHINWAGMIKVPWNIEPWRTGKASALNLCNP